MNPRRPDSAKTQFTKRTEASDNSKHELNSSKFSQTFSSGVNSFHDKPDEFAEYVARKDKEDKFKHLKSKLQVIQEKTTKVQEPKLSLKPFQRKRTSEKMSKKVEEKQEKPQEQLNLSRGFADRTKKKWEALNGSNAEEKAANDKLKSKINFDSFKIKNPGEKKETKKEVKVQLKKEASKNGGSIKSADKQITPQKNVQPELTQQEKKEKQRNEQYKLRQSELRDLERYVSDVQARNMSSFPVQYDRMISATPNNTDDLQLIDLNNFMEEPTQQGYNRMRNHIQQFDRQIGQQIEEESIDLEEVINGSQSPQKEEEKEEESYLQSMSASELKKRNAFITQILGGRISKKEMDELSQMESSAVRMHKLDREKPEEEEDIEFTEINMMKKQSQRMIQKNKLEAGGHLYRDCDYLPPELQQRIQQLLSGDIGDSPFDCDQLQKMRRRGIDEGIRMYREMSGASDLPEILNSEILPKDPEARNNAQKRILQEKMKSVNERLGEVDRVVVTKQKVKAMVKQFQFTKRSEAYNQLCQESRQRFEQNIRRISEAEELLRGIQQKENMNAIIKQIEQQYKQLEEEIEKWNKIDEEQLRQMEKDRLKMKLREVEQIQKETEGLEQEIEKMQRIKEDASESLATYLQLQMVHCPQIKCQGYHPQQTLQDIEAVISRKYEQFGQPEEPLQQS